MRGKRERGWEEKNERRERKTGGQTRGNWGGRSDIKNSPALPKPKGKASQEDQGHNHCQDDPARGAVLICGRGAHHPLFCRISMLFLCYSSVCLNNLLLTLFPLLSLLRDDSI